MAKINQDLIGRLASKLGISDKAVYPHITKVANETILDRHHAALVLAARRGININKYSTAAERAEIRGVVHGNGGGRRRDSEDVETEIVERAPARRPTKKAKAGKRTKENTVFVVHGRDEALRKSMFEFLRALGLAPQEWQQALATAKGNNPYVGAVIDEVMEQAQAVVVMLSPDDLVQLKD